MTISSSNPIEVSHVARIEEQLAAGLSQAAREIDHMDCFDDEQRAEIYAILKALKDDTAAHRQLVGQWVSDRDRPNA